MCVCVCLVQRVYTRVVCVLCVACVVPSVTRGSLCVFLWLLCLFADEGDGGHTIGTYCAVAIYPILLSEYLPHTASAENNAMLLTQRSVREVLLLISQPHAHTRAQVPFMVHGHERGGESKGQNGRGGPRKLLDRQEGA